MVRAVPSTAGVAFALALSVALTAPVFAQRRPQATSQRPAPRSLPRLLQAQIPSGTPGRTQVQPPSNSHPQPRPQQTDRPFKLPIVPRLPWPPADRPPSGTRPDNPPSRIPPIIVTPNPRPTRPDPRPQPRPEVLPLFPGQVNRPGFPRPRPSNPLPPPAQRPPVSVLPSNPLPAAKPRVPANASAAARMQPASAALTRAVAGDVERLLGGKLDNLLKKIGDPPVDRQRLAASGLAGRLDKFNGTVRDGASLKEIAESARDLRDTLVSLKPGADAPGGFDQWMKAATTEIEDAVLLARIDSLIELGGAPAAGPGGPGGFAPGGGGPGPGPGPGGPGDLAPGGDGPDPDPPADDDDGFHLDLDIHLWFGHGGHPIVCYPHYPAGSYWWIGETILVCGTGGVGEMYVAYGSPASVGLPLPIEAALDEAPIGAEYAGRILLMNPEANVEPVEYMLGDTPLAMDAGMMHGVRLQTTLIRFSRGPGLGEARYSLQPGSYRFVVSERGWDLVRTSFRATLDNSANAEGFQLLLDGNLVRVPGRSLEELQSDYPLLVEYDDGDGSEPARRQLAHGETYTVGINRDTGLWDLFAGDAVDSGAGQISDVRILASAGLLTASTTIAVPAK